MTASQPPQPSANGEPGPGAPPPYGQPAAPPPGFPAPGHGPQPMGSQPIGGVAQPPGGAPFGQPSGAGFAMDLKKLRMADYVIAGGTVLYLILSFFKWYAIFGFGFSGFTSGNVKTAFLMFLLASVWAALPAFYDLKVTFPRALITVGLAAVGFLVNLFAWFDTFNLDFSIWALLATIVAAGILLFAVFTLLPELRGGPALPGGLAKAGQWANQRGPEFGHQPGSASTPAGTPQQYSPPPQQYAPPPAPPGPGAPGASSAPDAGATPGSGPV